MDLFRLGTYNVQNLFFRYKFLENGNGLRRLKPMSYEQMARVFNEEEDILPSFGNDLNWMKDHFVTIPKSIRSMAAWVIKKNSPHVIALQEIESLQALEEFNLQYLDGAYPYPYVWYGNDDRQINMGLLSKFPVLNMRSNRFERGPNGKLVFLRDCVEVEIKVARDKLFTLVMADFAHEESNMESRELQARTLSFILKERFGEALEGDFAVVGNLQNMPEAKELQPLFSLRGLDNVLVSKLRTEDAWTYYNKKLQMPGQSEYILLSPSLASKNESLVPFIERQSLSREITIYKGQRFNSRHIKDERIKEHCALFADLVI